MKTIRFGHPQTDGSCAVFWRIDGEWVHKGWLMPETR